MECHAVYLPSEKCCEVPEGGTPEKGVGDDIYIFQTVFLMVIREYEKYHQKAKYSTKKREVVVLRDKKIAKKIEYMTV